MSGTKSKDNHRDTDEPTYSGKSIDDMALPELELEHLTDWFTMKGLQQSFKENVGLGGFGFAVSNFVYKARHSQQDVENRIGQKQDELRRNQDEIRERIRQVREGSDVHEQSLLDQISRLRNIIEQYDDNMENPLTPLDIRRAFVDTKSTIAAERSLARREAKFAAKEARRIARAERSAEVSNAVGSFFTAIGNGTGRMWDGLVGRPAAALKDWYADSPTVAWPLTVALAMGGAGFGGATLYYNDIVSKQPTRMISSDVQVDHPGAEAALYVTDLTRMLNSLVVEYEKGEIGNEPHDLIVRHDQVLPFVQIAREKVNAAQAHYEPFHSDIVAVIRMGDALSRSWRHHKREEEDCDTTCTTDDEGYLDCTTTCSCDYIDHTWTLNKKSAKTAITNLRRNVATIETRMQDEAFLPKVNTFDIQSQLNKSLNEDTEYQSLEGKEKELYKAHTFEWLSSATVDGNNLTRRYLGGFVTSNNNGDIEIIDMKLPGFKTKHSQRDHGCSSSGNPPQGFNNFKRVGADTTRLAETYHGMVNPLPQAHIFLNKIEQNLEGMNKQLKQGSDSGIGKKYDALHELSIDLHRTYNPKSEFTVPAKKWRTTLPWMLFFGLGALGFGGTYLAIRKSSRYNYNRRMRMYRY